MDGTVIVSARRTPQGRFLGKLSKRSAVELGVAAAAAALDGLDASSVDSVIVGNVLGAGLGMNVARQIALGAGVPEHVPAYSVNMMCGSGMQAIILADQALRAGDASVILCGGTESMSNAPYLLERARTGYRLGDGALVDSILRDGLTDAFDRRHMALLAEDLAGKFAVDRARQDAFALQSQQRYAAAAEAGCFRDELVPVDGLAVDEHPRPETTAQQLAGLRPIFSESGSVTAGNASGVNDGAAMLVVTTASTAKQRGWPVLARLRATATAACAPALMGLGPVHATHALCKRHGLRVGDFETVEINEAFACQTLACIGELGLDEAIVNRSGGAIALGHPIGASGARLVVHLAWQTHRGRTQRSLATLCIGGGMGAAVALEQA